ncbi:hypothetical protein CR513_12962, partial [Mucuna pruriens]
SDLLHALDPEIELTLHRLRKVRNTIVSSSSSFNSASNSDNSISITNDFDSFEYSISNINSDCNYEPKPMENNDRMLKELAMLDVVYQPWCIHLAGEDPHMKLKEFHVVCSIMRSQRILEDYIKMKVFPFSLDGVAKDWLYL